MQNPRIAFVLTPSKMAPYHFAMDMRRATLRTPSPLPDTRHVLVRRVCLAQARCCAGINNYTHLREVLPPKIDCHFILSSCVEGARMYFFWKPEPICIRDIEPFCEVSISIRNAHGASSRIDYGEAHKRRSQCQSTACAAWRSAVQFETDLRVGRSTQIQRDDGN